MNRTFAIGLLSYLLVICLCGHAPAQEKSSSAAVEQYRVAARYQELEQYDLAAKEWEKLVADFPDDSLAASGLHYAGVCHFQLGEYESAASNFEQFIAKYKEHELLEPTLTNLGLAHYNLATRAEGATAERLYRQAVAAFELRSKNFPAGEHDSQSDFYRGEALYALGKLNQAADVYRQWLTKHGDSGSPLKGKVQLALGSTLQELDNHSEAIATLEPLTSSEQPTDITAEAALRLGESLAATEKFSEAASYFARAAASKDFADADYALHGEATALFRAGDFANAADMYASLPQRFPQSRLVSESVELAGKSYYQAKNYSRAAEYLGKAYDASDHNAELAHWLIRALLERGQAENAIAIADNLLENKSDATILLDRADALYDVDSRRDESVRAYIAAAEASENELAAEARHLAAATALEVRDYATAIEQARALLQNHPQSSYSIDAQRTLAEALLQSGNADDAVATYRDLLQNASDQQRAASTLRLAWALSAVGDEKAIVETLQPAIAELEGEEKTQAEFLLGRALFRIQDFSRAIEPLMSVAQANPPSPWSAESALLLARAQAATDNPKAAIATLDELLAANPGGAIAPRAFFRRGQFYDDQDKIDAAKSNYQQLATNWPQHPFTPFAKYRLGELLYDAGDYEAALAEFKQVVSHAESNQSLKEKAQHLTAWAQYKMGEAAQAAASFQAQLTAHPNGPLAPDARWMIGESYFAAEKYTEALEAYKSAQKAQPITESSVPESLLALAMLHAGQSAAQLEKWQESTAWLEKMTEQYPDYSGRTEAEYELGWALSKLGKMDRAMPLLNKVAKHNSPLGARARFVVGELQFAANEYEDAVRTFFKVAYGYGDRQAPSEYHPWQAESLFEAARCLEQLDRRAAAEKLYTELVERFPDEEKAELAKNRLRELN